MGTRQDFEIACSAEAAFDGFTDAERILGWWHDRDAYRTVKWTSDLKEGGTWRAEFEAQEGSRFGAGQLCGGRTSGAVGLDVAG